MVAATSGTIFTQPTGDAARGHVDAYLLATSLAAVAGCCTRSSRPERPGSTPRPDLVARREAAGPADGVPRCGSLAR